MKTVKRLKLKDSIKEELMMGLLILSVVVAAVLFLNKTNAIAEENHKKDLDAYYNCVMEQSNSHGGWIVRSSCSMNYSQYDKELGLEYVQVGKDIYLKK